jgi:hypothetical protein
MQPLLVTTAKRAAPGFAEAVHFTGGWLAHEEAIVVIAPSVANTSAGNVKRMYFTTEFLLTVV